MENDKIIECYHMAAEIKGVLYGIQASKGLKQTELCMQLIKTSDKLHEILKEHIEEEDDYCSNCNASGESSGFGPGKCSVCGGSGHKKGNLGDEFENFM